MDLTPFAEIPRWLVVALGALAVVQVSLEIFALVVLFRTPPERLQFGKRWPWVLIILLVNLVGAVVFLVLGRKPEPPVEPVGVGGPHGASSRAARAVDTLFGPPEGGGR
jgi:hypothetical protein